MLDIILGRVQESESQKTSRIHIYQAGGHRTGGEKIQDSGMSCGIGEIQIARGCGLGRTPDSCSCRKHWMRILEQGCLLRPAWPGSRPPGMVRRGTIAVEMFLTSDVGRTLGVVRFVPSAGLSSGLCDVRYCANVRCCRIRTIRAQRGYASRLICASWERKA
ncbi:hypothetical protein BD310DRAFT_73825 [Dichomitus squalens]|uniref:Uncharacterized protein n=1 Tax=Dichomitus squalens TaxID=114155 RepID=A0A4Q9PK05_9APHY|nr:hypothetical protein BD310DRAFT_73825 [Dichomitus squalens]